MPNDFPATPTVGTIVTFPSGASYRWNGGQWDNLVAQADPYPFVTANMQLKSGANAIAVNSKVDGTGTNVATIDNTGALTVASETVSGQANFNGQIMSNATAHFGTGNTIALNQASLIVDNNSGLAAQFISTVAAAGTRSMIVRNDRTDGIAISFYFGGSTECGKITQNGTNTTYGTSSDERLKDFIGTYSGDDAIALIRADPVRTFNWKATGEPAVGWGAQTSYAVDPDLAVPGYGEPGDESFSPWGIDQGKRTPYLWAALSRALDRIDELEARLAALEAKP